MQELRIVAVSEDGSYAVLAVPGRSGRFALPIDERLRTVARGQFSRLAQYEIEVESPLRPKEIQDRIRAGETAEEIADTAGLPVDRIKRFEGPPLAERARWAEEAQRASIRGFGDAGTGPGPRLGELVTDRLAEIGASVDDIEWDSRRRPDGFWQVQLAYTIGGRMHMAEWAFDPRSSHVLPDDDEAAKLCLGEAEWQARIGAREPEVTATVTPIGVRSAGSAHGGHRQDDHGPVVHPSRRSGAEPPAATTGMQHGPAVRRATPVGADPAGSVPVVPAPAASETVLPAAQVPAAQVTSAGQREPVRPPMRPAPSGQPAASAAGRVPERPVRAPSAQAASAQAPAARPRPAQDRSAARGDAAAADATAGRATRGPATGQRSAAGPRQAGPATDGARRTGPAGGRPDAPGSAGEAAEGRAATADRQDKTAESGERPARSARRPSGGRSRRSSVPSWDEIMFGTSRQTD